MSFKEARVKINTNTTLNDNLNYDDEDDNNTNDTWSLYLLPDMLYLAGKFENELPIIFTNYIIDLESMYDLRYLDHLVFSYKTRNHIRSESATTVEALTTYYHEWMK